jgi:hypothetical protein
MFRVAYGLGGILLVTAAAIFVTPSFGQAQHGGGEGSNFSGHHHPRGYSGN